MSPHDFSLDFTVNHRRKEISLLLLLCLLTDIEEVVRIPFFLDGKVPLDGMKLLEISIAILEVLMSDNKCQLVFSVDHFDLLSHCPAPLKLLSMHWVGELLPDQVRRMEELDQAGNNGSNTMGLLAG